MRKLTIWDTSLQITCLMTIICIDSAVVYAKANMLVRKMSSCCKDYSLSSQVYPCAFWVKFKKLCIHKLQVAHNDHLNILIKKKIQVEQCQ